MEHEKPFGCSSPGCGMRFTNEDHLAVHQKKHEMALTLNSEHQNAKSNNNTIGFVDQTPTPTRFIRNCEEVGLFQDLQNVNPFDEHFRKAVETGKVIESATVFLPPQGEILNTPSVLPADLEVDTCANIDSDGVSAFVINDAPVDDSNLEDSVVPESELIKASILKSNILQADNDIVVSTSIADVCASPILQVTTDCLQIDPSDSRESAKLSSDEKADCSEPYVEKDVFQQEPDGHSLSKDLESQGSSNGSVARPPAFVQLVLKLPNGESVPVHMPPFSVVTAPTTTPVISGRVLQICPNTVKSSCFTKMKLREALKHNTNGDGRLTVHSPAAKKKQYLKFPKVPHHNYMPNGNKLIEYPSSLRRKRGTEENPDEKRKKFLERNRAAATRCRQKRKQWIQSLENKADELADVNQQLQNEVAMLRTEVTQLKSMLLAHKDCPVTQQQQQKFTAEQQLACPSSHEG